MDSSLFAVELISLCSSETDKGMLFFGHVIWRGSEEGGGKLFSFEPCFGKHVGSEIKLRERQEETWTETENEKIAGIQDRQGSAGEG